LHRRNNHLRGKNAKQLDNTNRIMAAIQ